MTAADVSVGISPILYGMAISHDYDPLSQLSKGRPAGTRPK